MLKKNELEGAKKRKMSGIADESDKMNIEKTEFANFYNIQADYIDTLGDQASPAQGTTIADTYKDFRDRTSQLNFESMFTTNELRYAVDKIKDTDCDDTVADTLRKTVQIDVIQKLLQAWGFVNVWNNDGSLDILALYFQEVESNNLWSNSGGLVQEILCQTAYQTLLFPRTSNIGAGKTQYGSRMIVNGLFTLSNVLFSIFGFRLKMSKGKKSGGPIELSGMNGPLFNEINPLDTKARRVNFIFKVDEEEIMGRYLAFAHRAASGLTKRMYGFDLAQLVQNYNALIILNNNNVGKYHAIFCGDQLLNLNNN